MMIFDWQEQIEALRTFVDDSFHGLSRNAYTMASTWRLEDKPGTERFAVLDKAWTAIETNQM